MIILNLLLLSVLVIRLPVLIPSLRVLSFSRWVLLKVMPLLPIPVLFRPVVRISLTLVLLFKAVFRVYKVLLCRLSRLRISRLRLS